MTAEQEKTLVQKAIEATAGAYVPYSGFHVGACVLGEDGEFYTGFNVENSSYGATICGERTAILHMLASGKSRKMRALAIASTMGKDLSCCGICRQFMVEFIESGDMPIYASDMQGNFEKTTYDEIMPKAFASFKATAQG